MAFFVSKEGVWDIVADGRSETPTLTVNNLKPNSFIKVTVNFTAHTSFEDSAEGFYFRIDSDVLSTTDVIAMTPNTAAFQGGEGWQTCALVGVFQVLSTTDGEATFECQFSRGDLRGTGTIMNFVMIAELL